MNLLVMLLSFTLIQSAFAAGAIKKSDSSPRLETPVIPGTTVPVESMNTAPTEPKLDERYQKSRFMLEKKTEKKDGRTAKGSPIRNDVKPKVLTEKPKSPEEKKSHGSESFPDQSVEEFTNAEDEARQ